MLCAKMTLTDTALVAAIDWKTAKRIDKKYHSRLVTGLDDLNPRRLEAFFTELGGRSAFKPFASEPFS
jgi:hypothetical protein